MPSKLLKVNHEVQFGSELARPTRGSKLLQGVAKLAEGVSEHKLQNSIKWKLKGAIGKVKKGPKFFSEKEPDAPEGTWWSGGKEAVTKLDEDPERSSSNETVPSDEDQYSSEDDKDTEKGSEVEYIAEAQVIDYGDAEEGAVGNGSTGTGSAPVMDSNSKKSGIIPKKPSNDSKPVGKGAKSPVKDGVKKKKTNGSKASGASAPLLDDSKKTVGQKNVDPWADSSTDEDAPPPQAKPKASSEPVIEAATTKSKGKTKKDKEATKPQAEAGWGMGWGGEEQTAPAPSKAKTKDLKEKKPKEGDKKQDKKADKTVTPPPTVIGTPATAAAPPAAAPKAAAAPAAPKAAAKASPFDDSDDSDGSDIKF